MQSNLLIETWNFPFKVSHSWYLRSIPNFFQTLIFNDNIHKNSLRKRAFDTMSF